MKKRRMFVTNGELRWREVLECAVGFDQLPLQLFDLCLAQLLRYSSDEVVCTRYMVRITFLTDGAAILDFGVPGFTWRVQT